MRTDKVSSRRPTFFADQRINPSLFRVDPKDYNHSGYDRGHMIPAADFAQSPEQMKFTFSMANVCPQNPNLNKGYWAKLEAWIRNLLESECEELVVFTGPVYAPVLVDDKEWVFRTQTTGSFPKLVHVPSHFFKVVLCKPCHSGDGLVLVGAFMVPNGDEVHKQVRVPAHSALSSILRTLAQLRHRSVLFSYTYLTNAALYCIYAQTSLKECVVRLQELESLCKSA